MSKGVLFVVAVVAALSFGVTTAFAAHNQTTPTGCIATNGPDLFVGTQFTDVCQTLAGDDVLIGHEDGDFLSGNDDDDLIRGGKGADCLGFCVANNENGQDEIRAGDGSDNASGGLGNDLINGGADNDQLSDGSTGDNDEVNGGSGNDNINVADLNQPSDADVANGGEGLDTCTVDNVDVRVNCELP